MSRECPNELFPISVVEVTLLRMVGPVFAFPALGSFMMGLPWRILICQGQGKRNLNRNSRSTRHRFHDTFHLLEWRLRAQKQLPANTVVCSSAAQAKEPPTFVGGTGSSIAACAKLVASSIESPREKICLRNEVGIECPTRKP
jgi:hypothetical protein